MKLDKIVNMRDYQVANNNPQPVSQIKKKRRLRKGFKKFLLFLVLIIALVIFLRSSLFTITEIQVTGNINVSREKVVSLAEIAPEDTLFKVNGNAVKDRLCAYPFIAEAKLKRHIPHTLVIEITEREPIGFIVTPNGYVQFDKEGMVLAVTGSMGMYNLPIITGIDIGDIPSPGACLDNQSFNNALNVIKSCDPQILSNIAEINIGANGYVLAYTYQGIEIKIGTADDVKLRLANLRDILAEISAENINIADIEYIDIRYKDVPVIKFKEQTKK